MVGGTSGTIQLEIYRKDPEDISKVLFEKRVNVSYACTASTFQNALNQFDGYWSSAVTVTRKIYNSNNEVIDNVTQASRIDYVA